MLERNTVNSIQKWLRANFPGCYLIKLESPSTAGILDMYWAWQGYSIWLEIKKPEYRNKTWKNKRIQEWHQKELRRNGINAEFIFSLQDVKNLFIKKGIRKYQPDGKELKIFPLYGNVIT